MEFLFARLEWIFTNHNYMVMCESRGLHAAIEDGLMYRRAVVTAMREYQKSMQLLWDAVGAKNHTSKNMDLAHVGGPNNGRLTLCTLLFQCITLRIASQNLKNFVREIRNRQWIKWWRKFCILVHGFLMKFPQIRKFKTFDRYFRTHLLSSQWTC